MYIVFVLHVSPRPPEGNKLQSKNCCVVKSCKNPRSTLGRRFVGWIQTVSGSDGVFLLMWTRHFQALSRFSDMFWHFLGRTKETSEKQSFPSFVKEEHLSSSVFSPLIQIRPVPLKTCLNTEPDLVEISPSHRFFVCLKYIYHRKIHHLHKGQEFQAAAANNSRKNTFRSDVYS